MSLGTRCAGPTTQDKETGIGGWTKDDVKRALTDGTRPNGVPLAHQMPYPFYKILTPADLDAVTSYVLSVPAMRNEVQPPEDKAAIPPLSVPGGVTSIGAEVPTDPVNEVSIWQPLPIAWNAIPARRRATIGTFKGGAAMR
jgi:hypothetical protein